MKSKSYFLRLIRSYILSEKINSDDNVDWDEIFRLAQIHSVQAIIYVAVNNLDRKPPIYDKLKEQFLMSVNISALQEAGMGQIIKKLTDENIDHTLMKGYVLRNYYPDKEARTFGDIDFLINEYDRDKCHKALLDIGFKYDEEAYNKYVWTYDKGVLHIEVHTDIIYEKLFNDFDYISYFREKAQNKILIKGNTYELRKEDHFIFVLVHLAKHFYNAGVGIRMILDVVVFLQRYGKTMDFNYINQELNYIQLKDFSNRIFYICKRYFDSDIDCTSVDNDKAEQIMDYILEHGVFGFDEKDVQEIRFKINGDKGFKLLLRKVFPSADTMKRNYSWFESGKRWMLPYAWIRRWIYSFTNKNKRKNIIPNLTTIVKDNEDLDRHINILKMVRLK